jgi:hypothetical protein
MLCASSGTPQVPLRAVVTTLTGPDLPETHTTGSAAPASDDRRSSDETDVDDVHSRCLVVDLVQDPDFACVQPVDTSGTPGNRAIRIRLVSQRRDGMTCSGETCLCPRCGCGPGHGAPSFERRRSGSRDSLCVDPIKRGI